MNIKGHDPGYTLGQKFFVFGIVILLIGAAIWFFVGCDRYIKPYCVNGYGNPFYWIGAAITAAGVLMFIVGWLVMKEEKVEQDPSSIKDGDK